MRPLNIALIPLALAALACQISAQIDANNQVNVSDQGIEIVQSAQPDEESEVLGIEVSISTSVPEPEPTRVIPNPNRTTTQEYSIADRPDDVPGYQIHFIYMLPGDGQDDFLDLDGTIATSAIALNGWLERETGARLRYDTYQGNLDITFMQLEYSAAEISELGSHILLLMEYEIKTRGFDTANKLYVIYYDGFFVTDEGYCGLAAFPPEGAGVTATLLLRGYSPRSDLVCPRQFTQSADYTGYFEMTILHELLHLMGMVAECAPNAQDGHVIDNSQDLLYHQYDGSYSPLYTYLDYRNDDYYGHGTPECPDFARSVFLDPEPENAEHPPGWEVSSTYIPNNPFEN